MLYPGCCPCYMAKLKWQHKTMKPVIDVSLITLFSCCFLTSSMTSSSCVLWFALSSSTVALCLWAFSSIVWVNSVTRVLLEVSKLAILLSKSVHCWKWKQQFTFMSNLSLSLTLTLPKKLLELHYNLTPKSSASYTWVRLKGKIIFGITYREIQ